ncbi:MAG: hypothetical protein K0S09_1887 [Sphingobacteriaceae bacterium]|jgi:hypothetical protein|nr:hypothetical protein [Sphingobacteriaceae bacterium]
MINDMYIFKPMASLGQSQARLTMKVVISLPVLLVLYVTIGTRIEHGDVNAGSMYGLWILPGLIVSIVSNVICGFGERFVGSKYSLSASFFHLPLACAALFFSPGDSMMLFGTLATVATINVINYFVTESR